MLSDFHIHLRPDDLEVSAAGSYTEENVLRYLDVAEECGVEELGFAEHLHRFRQALDVWRHPFWEENATDDLDVYCAFVESMKAAGYPVKLGIEADWIPHRKESLRELLEARDWDFVLGSVHFLADDAVDHPDFDVWRHYSADEVWSRYFRAVGDAAESGLFDVLAHPDLVKIWGDARPVPADDPRHYYGLALEGIARADVAIEVSTAGLRRPVGEIYPAKAMLDMCLEAGRSVVLASDAHVPEEVGYGFPEAVALLRDAGVERVCTFDGRRRSETEIR